MGLVQNVEPGSFGGIGGLVSPQMASTKSSFLFLTKLYTSAHGYPNVSPCRRSCSSVDRSAAFSSASIISSYLLI